MTRLDDEVVLTLILETTADDVVSDETLKALEDAEGLTKLLAATEDVCVIDD